MWVTFIDAGNCDIDSFEIHTDSIKTAFERAAMHFDDTGEDWSRVKKIIIED